MMALGTTVWLILSILDGTRVKSGLNTSIYLGKIGERKIMIWFYKIQYGVIMERYRLKWTGTNFIKIRSYFNVFIRKKFQLANRVEQYYSTILTCISCIIKSYVPRLRRPMLRPLLL